MTTLKTTIPTVKDALKTLLSARSALTGVQIVRGDPGEAIEREVLIVGQARGRHAPASIRSGRLPRDEVYSLNVTASVAKPGGTISEAEDRCLELLADVEDMLADDPDLSVDWAAVGVQAFRATAGDLEELGAGYTDTGTFAETVLRVEVAARLT